MSVQFRVSPYIVLRLEGTKSVIYICDKKLLVCKDLLLEVSESNVGFYNSFNSVDEIIDSSAPGLNLEISPEVEFWGHCSNIQAWVENNYDTKLLDKRIAFPILKELSESGVVRARSIFKEQLIERLKSGGYNILIFFLNQEYLKIFNEHELFSELLESNEALIMEEISKSTALEYTLTIEIEESLHESLFRTEDKLHFYAEDGHVIELELNLTCNNLHIARKLPEFVSLRELYIYYDMSISEEDIKKELFNFRIVSHSPNFIKSVKFNHKLLI